MRVYKLLIMAGRQVNTNILNTTNKGHLSVGHSVLLHLRLDVLTYCEILGKLPPTINLKWSLREENLTTRIQPTGRL